MDVDPICYYFLDFIDLIFIRILNANKYTKPTTGRKKRDINEEDELREEEELVEEEQDIGIDSGIYTLLGLILNI